MTIGQLILTSLVSVLVSFLAALFFGGNKVTRTFWWWMLGCFVFTVLLCTGVVGAVWNYKLF